VAAKGENLMVQLKAWDWKMVKTSGVDDFWLEPTPEAYYLAERWRAQGYQNFLDLGSGLGRHSIFFAKAGFNVSAIDLSEKGIEEGKKWAKESGLKIDFKVGDMVDLPYRDESFDCLLSFQTIGHTDTNGIKKVAGEIHRILKPNGEFYVTFPSKKSWGWGQNWTQVDENTKLREEEGPEWKIPHFYADYETVFDVFKDFKIIDIEEKWRATQERAGHWVDEHKMSPTGWHWQVLGKK
jgi:ubiquinone/menaquinone biosynthesis C-methylase UbiE